MNFKNDFFRSSAVEVDDITQKIPPLLAYGLVAAAGPVLASCAPPPSEFRRPAL